MNGPPPDVEVLIEAASSAFRERDEHGRIRPSPAWADLAAEQRDALYERQFEARIVESVLSPREDTATARSVLAVALRLPQLPEDDE